MPSTSANRVTPNSLAIASRGLARVIRPHMKRACFSGVAVYRWNSSARSFAWPYSGFLILIREDGARSGQYGAALHFARMPLEVSCANGSIEVSSPSIAVRIGARVAAAPNPDEVVVSSTVRDLVAGSGLRFSEPWDATAQGVPDEWRLDAVA